MPSPFPPSPWQGAQVPMKLSRPPSPVQVALLPGSALNFSAEIAAPENAINPANRNIEMVPVRNGVMFIIPFPPSIRSDTETSGTPMFLLSEFTPQPVMRQHELNSTLAPGVALQSGINENGA